MFFTLVYSQKLKSWSPSVLNVESRRSEAWKQWAIVLYRISNLQQQKSVLPTCCWNFWTVSSNVSIFTRFLSLAVWAATLFFSFLQHQNQINWVKFIGANIAGNEVNLGQKKNSWTFLNQRLLAVIKAKMDKIC